MDRDDYNSKMYSYLEENVISGNYEHIIDENLCSIRMEVEHVYTETICEVNPFLLIDGKLNKPLTPEPYLIPLLYGCPKIHKRGTPMTPIVASTDMIGPFLSEWLLNKLQLVADELNKYNLKNSRELIPEISKFKLEPDHELCSFDYVSMFTNIDVNETFEIITKYYQTISKTTKVSVELFLKCLKFFTSCATFFLFNGRVYKQIKGLAMGNKLAQVLAEIHTNYALIIALKEFLYYTNTLMAFLLQFIEITLNQ